MIMKTWKIAMALAAGLMMAVFPAAAQAQNPYFKKADPTRIGVYYYPEAWPTNQWARDIGNIGKLGFEFVHMGEFAWAFMEPEEGKFNFDWLEENVRLCAAKGLKVVLCTPTPTPPVWLVRQYPGVLMVDSKGRRMDHGSREHACWSTETYRKQVAKIVTELAKRFGDNPAVWGWQIDNELSHYGKDYCYCDECQRKFQAWLGAKYGTIDNLNRVWGNAFWSQLFQSYDQIRIPNQDEVVAQMNPHALLDFQRWFAEEAADYIRFQAGLLRKHTKKQWVTTNFMNTHNVIYPPLSGNDLDIVTWTFYPVHGNLETGALGFRLGNGAEMGFIHDFQRGINGAEGLMELQPGQVNWGDVNPQPYPGAVYMWIMHAFGEGAKMVCTYRYRQPLYGSELYHYGIVGPDGVTPTSGGQQYADAVRDIKMLRQYSQSDAKEPSNYAARRTALLYNVENRWDLDNHKQTARWNSMGHILTHYRALKRLGCPVDVIAEDKDFSPYAFLVAPAYQLVDSKLVDRWTSYVENGGHLVLTCRTAQKDRRGHLWEAPWASPICGIIGADVSSYDVLPSGVNGKVKAGKTLYPWGVWGDQLEPRPDTRVLAAYADQFYAGKAAATVRSLGKGTVTYIGVESVDGDLEAALMRGVFDRAGVKTESYDDQFLVDWRDGLWVACNFSSKNQTAPLTKGAQLLIGSKTLKPAGVAVWKAK